MNPDQRTGDAGAEAEPLGRVSDGADHVPNEGAVALSVNPGVEVVGDQRETEAGLLGRLREADEVVRQMLFAGERVAELEYGCARTGSGRLLNPAHQPARRK